MLGNVDFSYFKIMLNLAELRHNNPQTCFTVDLLGYSRGGYNAMLLADTMAQSGPGFKVRFMGLVDPVAMPWPVFWWTPKDPQTRIWAGYADPSVVDWTYYIFTPITVQGGSKQVTRFFYGKTHRDLAWDDDVKNAIQYYEF
jgi:pimeloyl-ACP methyl ester carboxylesterase